MRENQINQLSERLLVITTEFNELKAADEAHEGSSESEREIKTLTLKIDRKLKALEAEKDHHFNYQLTKMEAYTDEQITSLGNASIVKDVRTFKERIEATFKKIGELEDIMNQLNELLII